MKNDSANKTISNITFSNRHAKKLIFLLAALLIIVLVVVISLTTEKLHVGYSDNTNYFSESASNSANVEAEGGFIRFMIRLLVGDSHTTRDIAEYGNYSGHMEFEQEGMFSTLDIFPKELPPAATVKDYYYFCNNGMIRGLFDNSYQLYLVCTYTEDDFELEKNRLTSITRTSYNNEERKPIITNEGFKYPAIITLFGYKNSFEYALLDEEARTIAYVFAQSMGIENSVVPLKYRPSGFKPPENVLNEWGSFAIYK